ncbi:MAG: retroviral-like aspartic protease family protein [Bacillota bacterium]|nr:retroviral-like aspartic protease family protein [Bacillota bacterium]
MAKAFITKYNGISRVLQNEVTIKGNESGKKVLATWDTGATGSVITERLARELNLVSYGKSQSFGIGGTVINNVYLVDVELPGSVNISGVRVSGSQELDNAGFDVLIGMDIIGCGDFAVSNYNNQTSFTYRIPSVGLIDFVKMINIQNKVGPKHGKGKGNHKKK